MNKNVLLVILCLPILINAQIITGVISDKNTKEPIAYANILLINSKNGAYTNKIGQFSLSTQGLDSLKISSVGYETKYIKIAKNNVNHINIELDELTYNFDIITINSKKIKYSKTKKLGLKKEGKFSLSSLIGHNTTVYIKNTEHKIGKLKTIHLYLNRTHKKTSWKAPVFLAKLNIHIYEYDSINNKPGKELLHQNLIVEPKNKKYILDVNVKEFNIYFPKNGICIGVDFIDENNKYKKFNHIAPSLRYTKSNQKLITWSNYRNRGWRPGGLEFGKENANLLLNIDVLFPKN